MKPSKMLDVDFIGGQDGLTKEEETALNEFFKKRKSTGRKATGKTGLQKKRVKA